MQSYSLYELNEYIRQVIALNFTEPIWVKCEIGQVKLSRGQVYLELVEQDEDTSSIKAQMSGVIWYKTYLFLQNKLGELLPGLLQDGTQVLLKIKVDFHERYGLKLTVEDIDPSYTIGQLEMARQKVIARLQAEGIMDFNKEKVLPSVVQRIAIISSESAAGYEDFIQHLKSNAFGYHFETTLFQAALQGSNTEREISKSLDEIAVQSKLFDCAIIIRGGGSKLDLGAFDNYNIAYKIAKHPLPILTGIGHEIDQSAADMVAHKMLKTPTAVADFIIERAMQFEAEVVEQDNIIKQLSIQILHFHSSQLSYFEQILSEKPKSIFKVQSLELQRITDLFYQSLKYTQDKYNERLQHFENMIHLLGPEQTVKRGFAIVRQGNKIIEDMKSLDGKMSTTIQFRDGEITIKTKS